MNVLLTSFGTRGDVVPFVDRLGLGPPGVSRRGLTAKRLAVAIRAALDDTDPEVLQSAADAVPLDGVVETVGLLEGLAGVVNTGHGPPTS